MRGLNYRLVHLFAVVLAILCAGSAGAQPVQNPAQLPFDRPTILDGVEIVCTGVGLEARQNPSRIILRFPTLGNEVGKGIGAPAGNGTATRLCPESKGLESAPR
jgi:hypothetical protein